MPAVIRGKQADPEGSYDLPAECSGLLYMLAQYQWLAAESIWEGDRQRMEHALASNPLVLSLPLARKLLEKIIPLQMEFFSLD